MNFLEKISSNEQIEKKELPENFEAVPTSREINSESEKKNFEDLKKRGGELISAWRLSNEIRGVKPPESLGGVEVLSDEPLTEEDYNFIQSTKKWLDGDSSKPIQVLIVGEKNWAATAAHFGMPEKDFEFSGKSIEVPFPGDGRIQAVMVPSFDAVSNNSRRWQMMSGLMEKSGGEFDPKDRESLRGAYRDIFLRNMVAHEMSHLYQFSDAEAENILSKEQNSIDRAIEQSKYLDLREWLACAIGMQAMREGGGKNATLFLEANKIAADQLQRPEILNLSPEEKYPYLQASRTVQGSMFFDTCLSLGLDANKLLQKMNKICAGNDAPAKDNLQELLRSGINEAAMSKLKDLTEE